MNEMCELSRRMVRIILVVFLWFQLSHSFSTPTKIHGCIRYNNHHHWKPTKQWTTTLFDTPQQQQQQQQQPTRMEETPIEDDRLHIVSIPIQKTKNQRLQQQQQQQQNSDSEVYAKNTINMILMSLPIVFPLLAFFTYEDVAMIFNGFIALLDTRTWVAVDGGAYQVSTHHNLSHL